jgi:hypothetical protein
MQMVKKAANGKPLDQIEDLGPILWKVRGDLERRQLS